MNWSGDLNISERFGAGASRLWWVVLGLLLAQMVSCAIWVHTWRGEERDFFAFYSGGRMGLSGQNPYDVAGMAKEQKQYHERAGRTGDPDMVFFFSPPEALVVFAPFSKLSWKYACYAWLSLQTSLALGLACLAWTFGGDGRPRWIGPALACACLLNPLTYRFLALGQCSLIVASVIALGQWAFEARRPVLGSFLWGLAGIKPQLAIPFLALAFVLGGWRRLAGVVAVIGVLNVLGCLITTGTPQTLLKYVRFVTENHLMERNRVERDQISSWNHVVYVLGGPAWDLTATGMIASNAGWFFLIWLRHGCPLISTWVPEYALAAAAVGSVFCSLSHGYDLVILALMAPLLITRFKLGQRREVASLAGLIAITTIPRAVVKTSASFLALRPGLVELALSYRSLIVAILAAYLIVRGQGGIRPSGGPKLHDTLPSVVDLSLGGSS